jgi:hypothetical protein
LKFFRRYFVEKNGARVKQFEREKTKGKNFFPLVFSCGFFLWFFPLVFSFGLFLWFKGFRRKGHDNFSSPRANCAHQTKKNTEDATQDGTSLCGEIVSKKAKK